MTPAVGILFSLAVMAFIAWRTRGSPLALVSIPLTLAMGEAVGLRSWGWAMPVPFVPVPLMWMDVVFFSLVAVWIVIREKRKLQPRIRPGWDLYTICIVIGVVLLEVLVAWTIDGQVSVGVLVAAREWFYVALSILIWVDLLRRFTRAETLRLLESLAWVSVPLAAMYCLSSVGVHVYPYVGWETVQWGSGMINRDFLTFPFFIPLGLVWFANRQSRRVVAMVCIAILAAACVLTYTVTTILGAIVALSISLLVPLVARNDWKGLVARLVPLSATLLLILIAMAAVAPANLSYAVQRMNAVRTGQSNGNLQLRLDWFAATARAVKDYDSALGFGFSGDGARRLAVLTNGGVLLPDMQWAYVLAWLGWAGVIAVAAMYTAFVACSARIAIGWASAPDGLGLMLLGIALWFVCRSMAASEWLIGYPAAAGMFMAVAVLELRGAWHHERAATKQVELASGGVFYAQPTSTRPES